jgi:hypothetical protein
LVAFSIEVTGPDSHVVAGMQFYSDATLLDNKTAKAHPVRFALMNITKYQRETNIR